MNELSSHWVKARALGQHTATVPVRNYTAPEVFEVERDLIFRRAWLPIARVEEVARPGDYVLRELPTTSTSAIVVRGQDGAVRVFHNSCSHRGVALVCDRAGTAATFRCPYHAWLYGNDGSLLGMPGAADFPDIVRADHGLAPITHGVWNGFVFINLAAEPLQTLDEYLGEFGALFADVPFEDYPHAVEMTQRIDANWKSLVDAFNESYHIPALHSKTLGESVVNAGNPLLHLYDTRLLGLHSTATLDRNDKWAPRGEVLQFVVSALLPAILPDLEKMQAGLGIAGHRNVNRIGLPNFQIEIMTLFPNTLLQVLPSGWFWFQFWPTAPDHVITTVRMYSASPPRSFRDEFAGTHAFAQGRDVLSEDMAMVRRQQAGLASGGKTHMQLGENEHLLRFFADTLERYKQL